MNTNRNENTNTNNQKKECKSIVDEVYNGNWMGLCSSTDEVQEIEKEKKEEVEMEI